MREPSILADARWFGAHGIGRFARNVVMTLPNCVQLRAGPRPLSASDPLWLSYQIIKRRPAVFFSPAFNPPALITTPIVLTIHDLIHLRLPDFATIRRRLYYELLVKRAACRAYRVLTGSEHSRVEILNWSGLREERVIAVGYGVDPKFRRNGPRYDPGFPYVLYVGALRAHKNIVRLLGAFERIDHPDLRLILTGTKTPYITAWLAGRRIENRVQFAGCVPDEDLASLYRGAACLIMPSLMEGFGLPPLEAMACGTPVVASRAAALPEVVGDAAILVDPLDVDDIRAGMERILGDSGLCHTLREAGLSRARFFCWERVAQRVRAVIEEAAREGL